MRLKRHSLAIFVLLGIAISLRLATALALPLEFRFTGDAVEYISVAEHLLGQGIFGEESGVPYATIPPGYPLFVAGVLWVSHGNMMVLRVVQAGLATIMVLLLYLIGTRASSKSAGFLAAFAMAIYPPWILWPSLFLTETLFTFLLLLLVWALMCMLKTPTVRMCLCIGCLLGVTTLVRELMAPLIILLPILMGWVRMRRVRIAKNTVLVALGMVIILSPWLSRNYATFGVPFLSERLEAIRYGLTGKGYLAPRYKYLAGEEDAVPGRKPEEYRRRFGNSSTALLSWRTALSDPLRYLGYGGRRIQRLWFHPVGLASVPAGNILRGCYVALHLMVLLLAGIGFAEGLWRRNPGISVLAFVVIFGSAVILLVAWPHPRYTLPFIPLVFVGATRGLGAVAQLECCGIMRQKVVRLCRLLNSGKLEP